MSQLTRSSRKGSVGLITSRRNLVNLVPFRAPSRRPEAATRAKGAPDAGSIAAAVAGPSTVFHYKQIELDTLHGIALFDITPQVREAIAEAGVKEGFAIVLSRHTTTAVCINEAEGRLMDDIRQYLLKLAPPSYPYLHNDIHLRDGPENWPGGNEAWRAQEPQNAHSHLLSLLLGNSQTVPITKGALTIGTWQSIMLVELDGKRRRTVGIQIVGSK